jgi:hypothetical protein
MSSHHHRLTPDPTTFKPPPQPKADVTPASSETCPIHASERTPASSDGVPIAPSQRLPLIAHTLREARVAIAELRYEGRGGLGGFITELHDRHRLKTLGHSVDERTVQQLTGFLWQLVLRRQPSWNENAGSFGVVTWDLKTDLIRHVHHRRIVEVKTSLIEGL